MNPEKTTQLEKLGITFVKGNKGPNDKIFFYNEKPISMRELGELYAVLCDNEDQIYPKSDGYEGSDMIERFLKDVKSTGGVTPEIRKKYRLK